MVAVRHVSHQHFAHSSLEYLPIQAGKRQALWFGIREIIMLLEAERR